MGTIGMIESPKRASARIGEDEMTGAPGAARIEVRGLVKAFPGVVALDGVSLVVRAGEIHALLGENGAGKSTLGKIVSGVYQADAGTIHLDGSELAPLDEVKAGALGIGIVHQEGSLVPQLSVAENVFAGRQPTLMFGRVDRRAMREAAAGLLAELGVAIDPKRRVAELSTAQQQVVEIAKALSQDLRVLILDEPTAALTLSETERLFQVVRRLAAKGVSIVYVSHRLAEIFALCDRVTVLKDGRLVTTQDVAESTPDGLIQAMVGREVHFAREAPAHGFGDVLLDARGIRSLPFVQDASVRVRAGEIVCLAGLIGAGRTELCEAIFGVRPRQAGQIAVNGRDLHPAGPWDAMAAGIGMVCEDRKSAGLFLNMDVTANVCATVLDQVSAGGRMSRAKAEALAERFVRELRIATPSVAQLVGNLSGGNQQKVLLAKWLALAPRVLIVDEPTRGVDVGARSEIYRILRGLAAEGVALLVVSSDLPEVLALADRVVVMADGRTVGEIEGDAADEEGVLRLATAHTHLAQVAA